MRKRRGSFNIHAVLWGLVALVVVTGMARWAMGGGIGTSRKVHLSFWNGFTGPDGVVMLKIIEEFNRENPDVEVVMQRIPWATYYNKLTVAGGDGRGPDIFIVHADTIPRVRRAGFIADVEDLYEGPGAIDATDFDAYVAEQLVFNGKHVGVPLDVHPQGLFCNAQMLREAGLVTPDGKPRVPANREEFLETIRRTTIEPTGGKDKQWGWAFTYWGANFRSLVPQFGGRFIDEKGNAVMNSPENVRALEFLAMIANEKKAPPPDNGLGWFGYRTKRVAMVWDGIFMLGDLIRLNDLEYVGGPIPQIGDRPGTVANSHVMCLKKSLSARDREAACRFVKYVSDHSLEWAQAGQVPARKSVRAMPEFQKMQVQAAFAKQIPTMIFPPRTPVIFEFMLEMDRAVEGVVRGQMRPKEALDRANKNAQDAIDRDRREYPSEAQS